MPSGCSALVPQVKLLRHACPAREEIALKEGAQVPVMCGEPGKGCSFRVVVQVVLIKNVDSEEGLVNGARGCATHPGAVQYHSG